MDDGDHDTYTLSQLRIFPDHTSSHNGKWETEVLIHVPGTYTIPNNSIFEAVRPCAQLGVFKSLLLESLERFSIVSKVIRVLLWFYLTNQKKNSNQSQLARTRFPALGAGYLHLLRVLIGSLGKLCLL